MESMNEQINNRYSASIYDKLFNLMFYINEGINKEDNFKKEYECKWIK